MRKIIFKAKRIDNGNWVYGYIWIGNDHSYIIPHNVGIGYDDETKKIISAAAYEIDPKTICQYTGLTDKNGNKIWENDIVYIPYENLGDSTCRVVFKRGAFTGELYDGCEDSICYTNKEFVIGNIFDNLELLRKESEE